MAEATVDADKNAGKTPAATTDHGMQRLSEVFESSARRWELIVYPSLFAFVILAAYGFYLIYSLSKDVHYLAISVDTHLTVMSGNFQNVAENMGQLTDNVRSMTVSIDSMDKKVSALEPMLANMTSMDNAINAMNVTTRSMTAGVHRMGYDMNQMNQNVGRPMSFMNSFMPW